MLNLRLLNYLPALLSSGIYANDIHSKWTTKITTDKMNCYSFFHLKIFTQLFFHDFAGNEELHIFA